MDLTASIAPNVRMPLIGLGTYKLLGAQSVQAALDAALSVGYRSIDTAQLYENEREIGDALKTLLPTYGLERRHVFVTTKLHTSSMGASKTRQAFCDSLAALQLEYVDLFLVHYPKPSWLGDGDEGNKAVRLETWREIERLVDEGKCKAAGVSNYEIRHLEELKNCRIKPAVNQCEFHPHFRRTALLDYCRTNNIHFQSFTTLARHDPKLHGESALLKIAENHKATTSQVILAWAMQLGVSVCPKSANPSRIRSNFGATELRLNEEEMKQIDDLDKNQNYTSCNPWDVL